MIKRILQTPCFAFSVIALSSLIALASAFAAEAFFLLEPCKLCPLFHFSEFLHAVLDPVR